ncbi:MAG: hypothetical protein ACD_76C00004G0002 [uncultured bacterium]|nr:MAG: hypothetical protein ACD_76C00004G0002 [uncultured bacterium]HBD05751.1 chromosomal replication initiator protein DnaA [Candidatus Uhrbacteria bacterium]
MNTDELWQAALAELELKLSKANFTTWFKSTFISNFENGFIRVGVPNTFTKAWLEKKYNKEIIESLRRINSGVHSIEFIVEAHTNKHEALVIGERQERPVHEFVTQTFEPPERIEPNEFGLNPRYVFENFVVGKQNELAHAAAQAIASQPGTVYNPLFLYGGVGLGKTHLLQAIGHAVLRKKPNYRVLYATCETFTNDFIYAVRTGRAKEFKDRYRNVEALLIDDIQFITGKEGTQEEFFHTFNELHQQNKQIVITSDRQPKAIQSLENRLQTRLEWGMVADVGAPDFETRSAILELKCRNKGFVLPNEVLHSVASVIQSNIRELEGALNKIIAHHQFKNIKPTTESVQPILESLQPSKNRKNVTPRHLIETVASYFELKTDELLGKSREKRLAFPRQIIMFLMREEMKSSYPSIGQELGGRDHTTAMHAYDKISNLLQSDDKLQRDLELLKQKLYSLV